MSLVVEVKGLDALIADAEKQGANAQKLMRAALTNSTGKIQSEARALAPHRTGTLQRSILTQIDYPVGQVSVNEKYGQFIEEGTGIYGKNAGRIYPKRAKVLAWSGNGSMVFARSTKGMKARPFFRPGIENASLYIADQFIKVIEILTKGLAGHA